jgi:ABC-type multidrug transport system fused ATPase/permease subunit
MARQPLIFHPLYLFFLICSSCAWVGSVAAFGPNPAPVLASDAGTGRVERVEAVRDGCHAMITPPPSLFLLARQDQGQIQALSDQLQQLSAQSRSVSQSSQQLSQSLQQATQRLSQTEQQLASARAQQSAAEAASRSMSQASAEASRSAERVLSEASRAMSQAMSSVTSSMGASFASALASASRSISAVRVSAASVIQAAQADATALRVCLSPASHLSFISFMPVAVVLLFLTDRLCWARTRLKHRSNRPRAPLCRSPRSHSR